MNGDNLSAPRRGDVRKGIVTAILPEKIFVDIGTTIEGVISGPELERIRLDALSNLSVGDEVLVCVIAPKDADGFVVLSHDRALPERAWHIAQELLESQETFEGVVTDWNRGGLIVDFYGVKGFIPLSHVGGFLRRTGGGSVEDRLANMVGKTLPLKVMEKNRQRNQLILSARTAERQWREQRRQELLASLREGDVVEGEVSSLTDFGAFVDLGGADGLIHISELTWGRIVHPSDVLQPGDRVSVYVLDVDQGRGRIGLSLKRLQPEPWSQVHDKYKVGQLIEGEVTSLANFGAFALIGEGVEGLVHVSELSDRPIGHPREMVKVGDTVLLKIVSIDAQRRRIALSLKQVDPFERIKWEEKRQHALVEGEETVQQVVEEQSEETVAQAEAQEVVAKGKEITTPLSERQSKVTYEPLSLSDQIAQEMEEVLVLDTIQEVSKLLQVDIDMCVLKPPRDIVFDYSQLSEQLAAKLYDKSLDERQGWQVQVILSLQAATVLSHLGYNPSNKRMRKYLCAYCNVRGDGYFTTRRYDAARAYYQEALRLLPGVISSDEDLPPDLVLRFLKTFVHEHEALVHAASLTSLLLAAAGSKAWEPMDGVALGLTDLATVSFIYIKLVLQESRPKPGTESSLFEKLSESLQRILTQNGQDPEPDAELMFLLQRAVSAKSQLTEALEALLTDLIANSYALNQLHLLESTFAEIRSFGSLALCPTDRRMLEHTYQVYENAMKYIAQERFTDKGVYYEEIMKHIEQVRRVVHQTPTQYGKVFVRELLLVWRVTLSVEFYLEAVLTESEYLDRMGRSLRQFFEQLQGLKKAIYDPADQEAVDQLESIYRRLLQYSNHESVKNRIYVYEQLRQKLEAARESVLRKRTYLGIRYFMPILMKWRNILENDYQSFLTRAVRRHKGSPRRWETSEEEFLVASYETMNDLELAAVLGRTEAAIVAKARQMRLKRVRGVREEEQKDYWQNPYIVGPPVKGTEMFFGRQDIFDYVRGNLLGSYQHNTIVLHGRRRTGKSSILYQIERRDVLTPCITVLIDTQGLGRLTMPLLFYKISQRVAKALQRNDIIVALPPQPEFTKDPFWRFTEFLDDVEHATAGRKLIMMIDEFEKIQDEIRQARLDADLYDNFRHLIQHREDIGFILAGTMRMEEIVKDYTSPFFGSSLLKRISFLRENEAVALIRKPIEEHIRYEDKSVERILAITAGHPYFIQLTCQTLVNHLTYRKRDVVTTDDVDYVLPDVLSAGEGQFIFEWTSDTSPLDRLILAWLADRIDTEAGECSTVEIERAFSRLLAQPGFANMTVLETLDKLRDKEIVSIRQSRARFSVDLYRWWIKQNKDFKRVLKEERVDQSLFE